MKFQNGCLLLWILTIIIICIFTPTNITRMEGFSRYCGSCGHKSELTCSDCVNCGFCITSNGHGQCVPGDERGPYFTEDCVKWYHDYLPYFKHHVFPPLYFNRYYDHYQPRRRRLVRRRVRRIKK